jgi:superfamily II RNA helicase
MVVICNQSFPVTDSVFIENEIVKEFIPQGISLSDFQKWAIKSITEGDSVLVTAHTGSGKTLPAEFAIQYFTAQKKKVIYASPIKALSNQKLYDMRRKYPHISFGLLTGDCKDNPEADVLIMTTEILRNTLLNKKINTTTTTETTTETTTTETTHNLPLLFEMDFETELAAVVFDEVHYINDAERGSVWEQSILMLPPQIQLIMLSATIDRPEEFALWIETEKHHQSKERSLPPKQMYLASTHERVVPLTHYMWLAINEVAYKKTARTPYEMKIETMRGVPIKIASSDGLFSEENYYKMKDVLDYMCKNKTYVKRQFVLENLLRFLKSKEMLPAICFVFSRKHVEQSAREISFSLFEEDSMMPSLVENECRHILQSKLPNYKEYMELPEYATIVGLLQKGIAIHHAGIIPVLREMVELLFEKGYIRLLIATETFAVGLNMPTKTVIFAGISKFNGTGMRMLYPHEYTQMAGRAGRRGLDTIGHVFHCVNLFELPCVSDYRHMLTGPPQKLTSKFKISFNLALSMIETRTDILSFMKQSMLSSDINKEIKGYEKQESIVAEQLQKKEETLAYSCRTPIDVMERYKELNELVTTLANSARKKVRIELNGLEATHKFLLTDMGKMKAIDDIKIEYKKVMNEKQHTEHYIYNTVNDLNKILVDNGFIIIQDDDYVITEKGRFASQLQETHPLAMTDLYYKMGRFDSLDASELAGLFSCFYPVSVSDDLKAHNPHTLCDVIMYMNKMLGHYLSSEEEVFLNTGANYGICYDLMPYVIKWCDTTDETQCKSVIQEMKKNTGVFVGEFVKALLKVNAVALEMERLCETTQNIALLEKLRTIPSLTLKYIVTTQSLYL